MHTFPVLLKRLGIYLALFTICRLLFLVFNYSSFAGETFSEILVAFLHGIRFDISALVYFGIPLIVLHFIPFKLKHPNWLTRLIKMVFGVIMVVFLFMNVADIIYYKFTFKRATSDVFQLATTGGDFFRILPQLIKDFWYLLIIMVILVWLGIKAFEKIRIDVLDYYQWPKRKLLWMVVFFVALVIGARGGLQLKPIGIINAGFYNSPNNIPLVLNTPFSIITTIGKDHLVHYQYYSAQELPVIYSPVQKGEADKTDTVLPNVIIIILESFSSEYSGFFGKGLKTYTPFLDSLASKSFSLKRCYANGKKSIEGIPAILAGLPTLMNNPFITSVYAGNDVQSIAHHLHNMGYKSSFFHGGSNGTMGFDAFAKATGFDLYYGMDEYGNNNDFDGKWGIYDEKFYDFFLKNLNKEPQPFVSCFMSLSSHHPYLIPEKYDGKFDKGSLEIHESIGYADFALQEFFNAARHTNWFSNTLFVVTSDHTGRAEASYYKNRVGMYEIPLLFYHPRWNLSGIEDKVTQQADIMATVLDYVNYNKDFVSFGTSVLGDSKGFSVSYLNNLYEIISGNFVYQFDGANGFALYDISMDSLMQHNIIKEQPDVVNELERKLKGYLQSYNQRMIKNHLTVK